MTPFTSSCDCGHKRQETRNLPRLESTPEHAGLRDGIRIHAQAEYRRLLPVINTHGNPATQSFARPRMESFADLSIN